MLRHHMESRVLIFVTVILHTTMRLHEVQGQDLRGSV
jgi:hypothetical protein